MARRGSRPRRMLEGRKPRQSQRPTVEMERDWEDEIGWSIIECPGPGPGTGAMRLGLRPSVSRKRTTFTIRTNVFYLFPSKLDLLASCAGKARLDIRSLLFVAWICN